MFTSNTETGITVTYDDTDGTIDLVVGTLNQDTTGNAGSVTNGIYTTSSVTDLSDVSSVGSGAIITSSDRRNKLNGS